MREKLGHTTNLYVCVCREVHKLFSTVQPTYLGIGKLSGNKNNVSLIRSSLVLACGKYKNYLGAIQKLCGQDEGGGGGGVKKVCFCPRRGEGRVKEMAKFCPCSC